MPLRRSLSAFPCRGAGFLAVAALALTGCDPVYLIGTGKRPLAAMPDTVCITRTLESTPGVTAVEHAEGTHTSFGVAPHWGKDVAHNDIWTYHAGEHFAWVQVIKGRWETSYSNYLSSRQRIPDRTRAVLEPLMRTVDARLETQCGIPTTAGRKP